MGVLTAWLAEMAIITWRDVTKKVPDHTINGFPLPADYLATFLIFGTLGLVPKDNGGAYKAAALAAWGFVIATYLNALPGPLNPTAPPKNTGTAGSQSTPSTTIPTGG